MVRLEPEELAFMKERGITLCSTCRYCGGKDGSLCDMNQSKHLHSERGSCQEYVPKGKTPEQLRLEARRASEAQMTMFDRMGHAAGTQGFDQDWRPA